jgi:CRISPR-associated endoribonuclease Cas6
MALFATTLDVEAAEGTVIPDWMGERVRGALLGHLKAHDEDLATAAHADRPVQPYTVAWLGPRGEIRPGMRGTLRWTALDPVVAGALATRVLPAIGDTIELSGQAWRVTGRGMPSAAPPSGATVAGADTLGGDAPATAPVDVPVIMGTVGAPWAGSATFEALARTHLVGGRRPPTRVDLVFTTPTTFHSQGRSLPLPLPRLVFGSLIDRWNAYAPLRIDPEVLAVVDQAAIIGRYELRTELVPIGGGVQVGFVGRCGYVLPPGRGIRPADEYAWRVLHLMASYAFFAGIGAKTTMGMGTTRGVLGR